jgi:hypothetical protein
MRIFVLTANNELRVSIKIHLRDQPIGKEVSRGFLHWAIFYPGIYLIWRFSCTELIFMTCPLLQFSFLSHLLLA